MKTAPAGTEVVPNGASAAAVSKANEVLDRVFGHLAQANADRLKKVHLKLLIIPVGTKLTDLPEYTYLKGQPTFDSKPDHIRTYDDLDGAGGEQRGDTVIYAIGEKELAVTDGYPSMYGANHVPIHESGHIIYKWGLTTEQKATVDRLWDGRKQDVSASWLAPDWYTSANADEYFANSVAAYFSAPHSNTSDAISTYTPQWLQRNDPAMYQLLHDVFTAPFVAEGEKAGAGANLLGGYFPEQPTSAQTPKPTRVETPPVPARAGWLDSDYHGIDDVGKRIAELEAEPSSTVPAETAERPGMGQRFIQFFRSPLKTVAVVGTVLILTAGGVVIATSVGDDETKPKTAPGVFVPGVLDPSALALVLPVAPVPSTFTTDPSALGVEGPLLDAYQANGFLLRQTAFLFHDGLDPAAEDSWPNGVEGSFNWGVSYFPTHQGAVAVERASEGNLRARDFRPVVSTDLPGHGVTVFEPSAPRNGLINQIWYWVKGNAFLAIAGTGKLPPGSDRPDQRKLFTTLNGLLEPERHASGAALTKADAGQAYLAAVSPINAAAPSFRAHADTWNASTPNAQAQNDAQPLATALEGVESDLLKVAGRYTPARRELYATIAALEVLRGDLSDLARLNQIGASAWTRRYDADLGNLTVASNTLRSALSLPAAAAG